MGSVAFVSAVSLMARLGLAAVWLISGGLKVSDPAQTEVAVRAYQLLPSELVAPVALALPLIELTLGLLLLVGMGVRLVALASIGLLGVLVAAVISVWVRGLSIDCGCFGGGGEVPNVGWTDYALEIARDLGFAALAVWLAWWPKSAFAIGLRSGLTADGVAQ